VPGFFVHGLGHFYAGDDNTGAILLSREGLNIIPLIGIAGAGIAESGGGDRNEPMYVTCWVAFIGLFVGLYMYDVLHV